MKGLGFLYKKMERYFQKNIFQKFQTKFWKIMYLHKNAYSSFIIKSRNIIIYQMKGCGFLYKKMKYLKKILLKKMFENLK